MTHPNLSQLRRLPLLLLFIIAFGTASAADTSRLALLRDSMYYYFDRGTADEFRAACDACKQEARACSDYYAYYSACSNEIIYELNASNIFQAYKLALGMSREMRQENCDSLYYLATNMLGLIYADCSNIEGARRCFLETIEAMKQQGKTDALAPVYMDLAFVELERHPAEAVRWAELAIAQASSDDYRCDAYAFRGIQQFRLRDMEGFTESYRAYKGLDAQGISSTYGKFLDIYWLAYNNDREGAVRAAEALTSILDRYEYLRSVYEYFGDDRRAYEVMKREMAASDSLNSVILTDNLQGISNELELAYAEQRAARHRIIALMCIAAAALMSVVALVYIVLSRRRFTRQLQAKNQALLIANEHALESDRMKSAFIRNMSHELRTPLNIISGFTQVIANPGIQLPDSERAHIAQQVQENTLLITRLVDEVLALSTQDAERHRPKQASVPLAALCNEVLQTVRTAGSSPLDFCLLTEVDDDYTILSDADHLRHILLALVDNAAKFTSAGSVSLHITADKPRRQVSLAVEDTGTRIPAEETEHIFERFVKLDQFRPGLGLGLTLARQLAVELGGTLSLDTSFEGGNRFVLTLPDAPQS
ncbi:MAG: HAMP domain-containing histidine kinase [Prevotella sp.]|nr:HAMP domain-containing histidine kinase [Prevotella sp.]